MSKFNLFFIIALLCVYACDNQFLETLNEQQTVSENRTAIYDPNAWHPVRYADNYEEYLYDAERWPELVGDTSVEKRYANVSVTIDARYSKPHSSYRMAWGGDNPWWSTGLYAAPGEIITVIRPEALKSKTLKVRINASNCDLKNYSGTKHRADKIWIEETITADTFDVYNYYGGNIYIVTDSPLDDVYSFTIQGGVKSPDFVLGMTNPEEWLEEIQTSTVPFAELEGNRIIWSFPTKYLRNVEDPKVLMEYYDDAVVNTFNRFNGLTDNAKDFLHNSPTFKHRAVADINTCAGAAHAGYPCMFGESMNYAARFVQLNLIMNEGGAWGFFHELGHNYQTSTWMWKGSNGAINEVSNNLYIMYDRNRRGFWSSQADSWSSTVNSINWDDPDKKYETLFSNGDKQLIPFCQLAQQFGWKVFAYVAYKARELDNTINNNLSNEMGRREFFCKRVSEFLQMDMRPFFDAWGIQYGTHASHEMAMLPAYDGEPFWLEWDGSLIGNTDPLTQADLNRVVITLPDDTYNLPAGQIVPRNFSIYDFYGSDDESYLSTMEGKPENIFDGVVDKTGGNGYWVTPYVNRPVYNPQPWIIIDLGDIHSLNKFAYRHRNFSNIQVNAHTIQLETCTNIENPEWRNLREFELPSTLRVDHEYPLPLTTARYVKITFIKGQLRSGATDWNYSERGGISIDEIKFFKVY